MSNRKAKKIVISFDLDFTLINNTEGILNSFKHAFKINKLPQISENELRKTIGRPLKDVFQEYPDINPDILIKSFREYYKKEGMYQVVLYPNVKEILMNLRRSGITLGIITSKKQKIAKDLVSFLGLQEIFQFVIGETDSIKNKQSPEIIKFFRKNFPNHFIIIVGDHLSDLKLAEMLKSSFIGILTGNHSKSELSSKKIANYMILEKISLLKNSDIERLIED